MGADLTTTTPPRWLEPGEPTELDLRPRDPVVLEARSPRRGERHVRYATEDVASTQVARRRAGWGNHDSPHSYGTWMVDDRMLPNTALRVSGRKRASTAIGIYTVEGTTQTSIQRALDDAG